ncbi:hypothetical protein [Streptomyces phaeoluteigriseus]|nr:hypothetical protein [Streptomyces phaeoluteigriseus]
MPTSLHQRGQRRGGTARRGPLGLTGTGRERAGLTGTLGHT